MNEPNKCRICEAGNEQQILRAEHVFGSDNDHKFWQCQQCDLVYLYPIPSQEDEDKFYAQEFEKFMEDRSANDRDWSGPEAHIASNLDNVKRRWEFLKEYIQEGQEVLEIGCSSGFMMDGLKAKGIDVVGIEPSGGFGEFLESRGHEHYSSIDNLIKHSPERKFDMVMHFFVLEHIRDTKAFLESQLALLIPGGWIVAEVPNVNDPLTSLFKIPAFEKFYWSIAHHYYFNPKSLTPVLESLDCNFHFVNEQRYDLSNHITWLQDGRPGGQGRFNHIFSEKTLSSFKDDLIKSGLCDTFFLYIQKK
jgi:2-polyprenyl-3-methyl-5-hydroxy-6-metoxy-1,4-benzoquinol methylase